MQTRAAPGLLWPTIAAGLALVVLLALGTWQVERKAWKDGLIRQIAERIHAPPVPLDTIAGGSSKSGDLEYTRVVARGRYLRERSQFFYAFQGGANGWHVYTPLVLADGKAVLVNRGFVTNAERGQLRANETTSPGEVDVIGLVRKPGIKGTFTPDNDVARNVWYWRDLAGMAGAAFPARDHAVVPFFIDAQEGAVAAGEPRGGVTILDLPNRHLEYAMTWYGLALTLVGVYLAFVWQRLRYPSPAVNRSEPSG